MGQRSAPSLSGRWCPHLLCKPLVVGTNQAARGFIMSATSRETAVEPLVMRTELATAG
jgi:hypothetical protein